MRHLQSALSLGVLAVLVLACNPLKEPTPNINVRKRTSPALQSFGSCDQLAGRLRANLAEEMRVQLLQAGDYYGGGWGLEDGMDPSSAEGSNSGRQEGVDYSGTNNQEQGVDEADFVKTDGYYIYTINGNRLEILGVPEFGQLTHVSSTPLEGYPAQMLLEGDRAVVYSMIYTYDLPENHPLRALVGEQSTQWGWWYGSSMLTKLTVLDVSNRAEPQVLRQLYLEGWYQTAREIEGSVRMVSYAYMDIPGLRYWPELPDGYWQLELEDQRREIMWNAAVAAAIRYNDALIAQTPLDHFLPQIYERFSSGAFVEHRFTRNGCQDFAISDDGASRGFTSIFSLDLFNPVFAFDSDHIVSNHSTVYASLDTLLIAEPAQDWWWFWRNTSFEEATNIHRFDISLPGKTRYTGSGRVPGLLWGQFMLSEQDDFIRAATTEGRWRQWWLQDPPPSTSNVFVLAGQDELQVVGHVGGIAPDERLWSSRFVGDRGYLVTFRNIDPLWTIDLSNPYRPRIMGELEVPGVSTYIHPMENNRLLTIGYGGDEDGLNWGTQVSLFDVSDFSAPRLTQALTLNPNVTGENWTWTWSEATWEHKAFQYWGPMATLAIPLSTYRYIEDATTWEYRYEYKSELALIRVDTVGDTDAMPLERYDLDRIDHSDFFNNEGDRYWDWRDVRRSIFMGDYIYAISDRGVTAHNLLDLSLAASVALPGSGYDGWYWCW